MKNKKREREKHTDRQSNKRARERERMKKRKREYVSNVNDGRISWRDNEDIIKVISKQKTCLCFNCCIPFAITFTRLEG